MNRIALLLLIPLMLLGATIALIHYIWATIFAPAKALQIAIGYDQLANVALNGNPDETISSRADRAREEQRRWGCVLCKILDKIEKDHCRKSRGI